jgi:hypothetical protein
MTISTERKATEQDIERIKRAEIRFIERHNLNPDFDVEGQIECMVDDDDRKYYGKLWAACFRRAVKSSWSNTIAYGHIGKVAQ